MDKPLHPLDDHDPLKEAKLNKLQLIIYLLPLVGWVPALITLNLKSSTAAQRSVSRTSVLLIMAWVISYSLCWFGSLQGSDILTFRLLYLNGLLTSGYILVSLGLILKTLLGKRPRV